jgi:predicted RNA binding protein YcfA (HicA-like mRNA interferase family)
MPSVPVLRPREVVRAFEKLGWIVARASELTTLS